MKKIKCIKCDLYFRDRKDEEDSETCRKLCWNCRFIWKTLGHMLLSFDHLERINREVVVDIDDIKIRKKRKKHCYYWNHHK